LQPAVHLVERGLRGGAHAGVGLAVAAVLRARDHRREQLPDLRITAGCEFACRGQALFGFLALQRERSARELQRLPDFGVGFARERALDDRQRVLVVCALQFLRRAEPCRAIRTAELQRRDRGADLAADAVVDDDDVKVRRRRPECGAGDGIGEPAAADDDRVAAVVDQRQCFIAERGQYLERARILARGELADRVDLRVRILGTELCDHRRMERGLRWRSDQRQRPEQCARQAKHGISLRL